MTTTQGAATRAPIAFTILPEAPAALGESPVWDEANGVLWWVDIDGHTVRRTDPDGGATRDRKSTRLNSSHSPQSRMPSSA